jgi:hypothetical protein
MVAGSAINDVLRGLSVALQLIGVALLLLGVAEVRSWLDRTADASRAVKRSLVQRLKLQVENVRHRYATLRGRPFHTMRHVSDAISIGGAVTATVGRAGPHPEGLSDHERLDRVETRIYGVQLQVDQLQEDRADDARRLVQLRDQFRAELREATNAGWQFIMVGLAASAVGIAIGAFA